MLRSLLAPLRNLQDRAHETSFNNDAQHGVSVAATQGSALASQVKSLVEELKLAEDTPSRIMVNINVGPLSTFWIHGPRLADIALS